MAKPPTLDITADPKSISLHGHTMPQAAYPSAKVGDVLTLGLTLADSIRVKVIRVDKGDKVFHVMGEKESA